LRSRRRPRGWRWPSAAPIGGTRGRSTFAKGYEGTCGRGGIKFDDPTYSTDVNLGPGYSLTLAWTAVEGAHWFSGRKTVPRHTCGDKDYRNSPEIGPILEPYAKSGGAVRSFASGTLRFAPDFADPGCLEALAARENVRAQGGRLLPARAGKPASVTVLLASPYVMSRASGAAEGADKAEVSVDGGKTWNAIDLGDFSETVGGLYHALVRIRFSRPLSALHLEAVVQHNRCALPYLAPGRRPPSIRRATMPGPPPVPNSDQSGLATRTGTASSPTAAPSERRRT